MFLDKYFGYYLGYYRGKLNWTFRHGHFVNKK
jgi:hypothetical protein